MSLKGISTTDRVLAVIAYVLGAATLVLGITELAIIAGAAIAIAVLAFNVSVATATYAVVTHRR